MRTTALLASSASIDETRIYSIERKKGALFAAEREEPFLLEERLILSSFAPRRSHE